MLITEQLENIQIDHGLVFIDYGEETQRMLAPTRGGAQFSATKTIREIEYDGRLGKTKGAQVIEEIGAMLSFAVLDTSIENIDLALPQGSYDSGTGVISSGIGGLIAASKYLTNVTMFAKVAGGGYKKITIFNAMNEADFVLATVAKGESTIPFEIHAHWDPTSQDVGDLYTIEDVQSIDDDLTPPTVTPTPADGTPDVSVGDSLTALFSEPIREGDITTANFRLIKASDGTIVAGNLSYSASSKTATFKPTSLDSGTAYIWTIGGVRDLSGNEMVPVAVNFTTA
jgi:hypothetical protein